MENYIIRAAVFEGVELLSRSLGVEAQPVMREFGVDPALLKDPDTPIAYEAFLQIINVLAEATTTPHFGLLLARRQSYPMLGQVGLALRQAPTIGEAIDIINCFLHLQCNGHRSLLSRNNGIVTWYFVVDMPNAPQLKVQGDRALGLSYQIVRDLTGTDWAPNSIHFAHATPENTRPYKQFFRCPVLFEQELTGMSFPLETLSTPNCRGSAELYRMLRSELELADASRQQSFSQKIRRQINLALEGGSLSIDSIASQFGISPRTLQRKLKQNMGLTFRELADEARTQVAQRYLRNSTLSLLQISDILGYSELAAFSRAFKRNTGVSPKNWRKTDQNSHQ